MWGQTIKQKLEEKVSLLRYDLAASVLHENQSIKLLIKFSVLSINFVFKGQDGQQSVTSVTFQDENYLVSAGSADG